MKTLEEVIGTNAGRVWKAMHGNEASTTSDIAKRSKLKVAEVEQALGWLAREGKLEMEANGKKATFRLKWES